MMEIIWGGTLWGFVTAWGSAVQQSRRCVVFYLVYLSKLTDDTHTHSHDVTQLQSITLDNASSNGTMCETVQRLHEGRNVVWNAGKNQLMYVLPVLVHNLMILI